MIIIYRKSDLKLMSTVPSNMTAEQEIILNTIPNFSGVVEDYDSIETDFTRFHLERDELGEAIVVEDGLTIDEKKSLLRNTRNTLLDEADIKYCNADKWELMDSNTKTAWRSWKQNMKDWVDVDLDNGTFPTIPSQ